MGRPRLHQDRSGVRGEQEPYEAHKLPKEKQNKLRLRVGLQPEGPQPERGRPMRTEPDQYKTAMGSLKDRWGVPKAGTTPVTRTPQPTGTKPTTLSDVVKRFKERGSP